MKDYKRETVRMKEELEHQQGMGERLRTEAELSESLRLGMASLLQNSHQDLKIFCRASGGLNFPELNLGVNPNELHILEIEGEGEEEPQRCFFDRLFTDMATPKDMFVHMKEFLKSMVKGDQTSFVFLNNGLD